MSGVHLHLLLTHVPVVGIVFGLLVFAYAWFGKKTEATRIGMGIFVLSGLAAVVVYLTGEAAEEAIEGLAGISETLIERHEAVALVALVAAILLGLVSVVGLWLSRRTVPRWFSGATLGLAMIVFGIMAYTANLGGQINHPEIRSDAQTVQHVDSPSGGEEADEHDEE